MLKIENIIKQYNKVIRLAEISYNKGNFDKCLFHIKVAANIAYNINFKYTDKRIEELLENISGKILSHLTPSQNNDRTILFYDSFGWDNKGLTQQYVRALMSIGYDIVYVVENGDIEKRKELLSDISSKKNNTVIELDNELSYTSQIIWLYNTIINFRPSKIFLHILPDSVVPVVVSYRIKGQNTVYNINLTDHAFWIGSGCIDYNIEFREHGCNISMNFRGLKKNQLLLLPFYPILNSAAFKGFDANLENKVVLFSGGSYYKIYGKEGIFFKVLKLLFDRFSNIILLYAGWGYEKPILEFIKNNHLENRLILIGERDDINEVFKRIDIYLGTFPFGGGLMSQYASVNKKPIVTYNPESSSFSDMEKIVCQQKEIHFSFKNLPDLLGNFERLVLDERYRIEYGEEFGDCVISPTQFKDELEYILINTTSLRKFNDIIIKNDEIVEWYLEINNLYLHNHELIIITNYRLKTFYLFPSFMYFQREVINGVLSKIRRKFLYGSKHNC